MLFAELDAFDLKSVGLLFFQASDQFRKKLGGASGFTVAKKD